MKTQRELIEESRKQLDEKFEKKYPNGKFCLHLFYGQELNWCARRATGARRPCGITTRRSQCTPDDVPGEIKQERFQNCSFGNTYNYDTLEKMLKAARKRNVPEDLIKAFVSRYNDRANEGFTK